MQGLMPDKLQHPSYHHIILEQEAETRLAKLSGIWHLILYSMKERSYMLSVHYEPHKAAKYFKIVAENMKYQIEGKKKTFSSLDCMLEHYQNNSISQDIPSIGNCYTFEQYSRQLELDMDELRKEKKELGEHNRQIELDMDEMRKEKKELAEKILKTNDKLQATKEHERQLIQEAEEQRQKQKELHDAEQKRQKDLLAVVQQKLSKQQKKLQKLQAKLHTAEEQILQVKQKAEENEKQLKSNFHLLLDEMVLEINK